MPSEVATQNALPASEYTSKMVPLRTPALSTGYLRAARSRKYPVERAGVLSGTIFDVVFARCAQPENAGAFHNPHIAIAAAPAAQIVRRRGVQRFEPGARPAHDDAPLAARGGSLGEQLAGSRQGVDEVGEALRAAIDFQPFERTASGQNVQLGQAVFTGKGQFAGGARTPC